MGLLVASANASSLIEQQRDLEYKITLIREAKDSLQFSSKDIVNAGSDLDPDSPTYKQLQLRKERLNNLEKKLDMQLDEYNSQLTFVKAELAAAKEERNAAISEIFAK